MGGPAGIGGASLRLDSPPAPRLEFADPPPPGISAMPRRLEIAVERWPLHTPFTISRGTKTEAEVVAVRLAEDGAAGRGEGVPYARYGESAASVVQAIEGVRAAIEAGADRAALAARLSAGAARNALDCALWDLEAKRTGTRAWEVAGIAAPGPLVTCETISIGTAEAMGAAAAKLAHWPLLKLKLDRTAILERVRAVRAAAPRARLIADANEAWDAAILMGAAPALADLGVEMIEQPLPADADGALVGLDLPIPLCADESCHTAADLDRLAGRYRLVNVKLDKTGGLTEALRLADAARARGLGLMVGCMVSTSLSIAPAMLVAQFARYIDLDGPRWLERDREAPLRYADGQVFPPNPALWG